MQEYLPGHNPRLQSSWSNDSPTHGRPPCLGYGASQSRERSLRPRPQVLLHGSHGVQAPHPPATKYVENMILKFESIKWDQIVKIIAVESLLVKKLNCKIILDIKSYDYFTCYNLFLV